MAFTEHGAIMAAAVLNSARAIEVSVYVVRAFVELRGALGNQKELARRVDALEQQFDTHDCAITQILDAIRRLTQPPESATRRRIGFL